MKPKAVDPTVVLSSICRNRSPIKRVFSHRWPPRSFIRHGRGTTLDHYWRQHSHDNIVLSHHLEGGLCTPTQPKFTMPASWTVCLSVLETNSCEAHFSLLKRFRQPLGAYKEPIIDDTFALALVLPPTTHTSLRRHRTPPSLVKNSIIMTREFFSWSILCKQRPASKRNDHVYG